GPLSFQWSLNGADLEQATNSALTLIDVRSTNAGTYSVTVSSPFGTTVSSNAILTVDLVPVIMTEPQSQTVIAGNSVTFSAPITGAALSPASVSSGSLQLWLKADAGIVTNASGQVSQWQDQSGNSNNASQSGSNCPSLVFPAGIGGRAAVRFNGVQAFGAGDYLYGTGNVAVSNAMTAFTVYNAFTDTNSPGTGGNCVWVVGSPGEYGASRGLFIVDQELDFATWTYDYHLPGTFPTNTYRLFAAEVNSNLSEAQIYDISATSSNSVSFTMNNASTPAPGYYVGGLANPSHDNLDGDVAEVIVFSGVLTDADRMGVLAYLEEKYYQTSTTNGVSFQWQFDGTNIAGATNASLTLTNVQAIDAGSFTVTITDLAGSTTSSNAVLTFLSAPAITASPASQSVLAGTTVMFSSAATGTAPLTYQWQFDGTNIAGATNTTLTVTNALVSNAGSYTMVATNPYGTATSSAAVLTVDESSLQVVSTSAAGSGTVMVSINLLALGTESGIRLSLDFNPAILSFMGVNLGSGASGGALLVNSDLAGSGQLGLGAAMFSGTFPAGTQDVFDVTFQVAAVTNATTTSITFGNQPLGEQVSDSFAETLPVVYLPGSVSIPTTVLAGDVSPQPNGNEAVDIDDWIQEGRFVAGLDIITNASEYMRADCAPRGAPAGGPITVADWVQVGRYAVGLDPLTAASGATNASSNFKMSEHPVKESLTDPITLVPLSQGGTTNSVAVELIAKGNETALQFSVNFNPALIQFVNARLGSVPANTAFIQNTNEAANGSLGFVVGLMSPATFAAGTQELVKLNFAPVSYSNTTAVVFGSSPIQCLLVDSNADVLSATYENAALAVGGQVWPRLSINQAGNNIVLLWPSSAAGFALQASSSLGGGWTNVVASLVTVGGSVEVTSPISTSAVYYRLQH
ncbi:MAG TPA: immunoglobulin domain-containing protein, partial [Verrucomicrobiae bacterium]